MIMMKIEDVAKQIGVSPSTIKKYYLLVEQYGYRFKRNNQGQLTFSDNDLKLFRQIIATKNKPGITVQKAIEIVMSSITDLVIREEEDITDITDRTVISAMTKHIDEIKNIVVSQNKLLLEQQEEIKRLIQEQEVSRRLIEEAAVKKRDELLMQSIKETRDLKEEIMEQAKKSWWKKIF